MEIVTTPTAVAVEAQESLAPRSLKGCRVAVNVSLLQLCQEIVQRILTVADLLGKHGCKLEVEITESVLMRDLNDSVAFLKTLSDRGVDIAVDDFGLGFSNLARLKDLPIHRIKIDQSFVRDFGAGNDSARQIVKAIISMAQALNLQVTAEGVESAAQAESLLAMGCDEAQGYCFSKPVRVNELPQNYKYSSRSPVVDISMK